MAKARARMRSCGDCKRSAASRRRPSTAPSCSAALADPSNVVVGQAAEIVGERILSDLAPDLAAGFHRFLVDPAESDKRCLAKHAIVEALNKIEYDRPDVFLIGIRHVQMEPRFGGAEDSAALLRGSCGYGLLRLNYPNVVYLLVDLLADPEKPARLAAVKALGELGTPAAVALLRFKVRTGDHDPEVTAECLAVLMTAAPAESLDFVASFLDGPSDVVQEGAAFALGESRRADALDVLKERWPQTRRGSFQEALLLAVAMTRLPAALDFLLGVLAGDNRDAALAALSALAIHRHGPVRERIAEVVARKGDAALQERFNKQFKAKE